VWPEWRVAVGTSAIAEVGGGASLPVGAYVRLGALAGAGPVRVGEAWPMAVRAEVSGRFSPDPFGQQRWAPYATGGAQLRCRRSAACEPALLTRIGIEGPLVRGRWRPALELGLGGGAHVAVGWRRSWYGRR
jgi:hypothetical protein